MAYVLTVSSTVKCTNEGSVSLSGSHKLKVSGKNVIVPGDLSGKSISGCKVVTDTNKGTKQCTSVISASGESSKLKVGGKGVAIESLSGDADGLAPDPEKVSVSSAGQTKLKA